MICMNLTLQFYCVYFPISISYSSVSIAMSMTLTATQLITERKEGVIDRTWVAGDHVITH